MTRMTGRASQLAWALHSGSRSTPAVVCRGASSTTNGGSTDPNLALRRDIKFLGWALGDVIRRTPGHGEETYETVERLRGLAKAWRCANPTGPGAPAGPDGKAKLQELVEAASQLQTGTIVEVARAFKNFLALSNTAEANHRVRRGHAREAAQPHQAAYESYPPQPVNTTLVTIQALLSKGTKTQAIASPQQIYEALCSQCVEIILTAHPTEVNRRTVVQRHRGINTALAALDRPDLSWYDREREEENLVRQVDTLWHTDEIRREKPTPRKEARHGLEIVATSMWHAVPNFLRRLDAELLLTPGIGKALPPDVRFHIILNARI